MKYLPTLSLAMEYARQRLINTGKEMITESWQGIKKPIAMFEAFDVCFQCPTPYTWDELIASSKPNLPWADEHFEERISRKPYNPPPSAKNWPFAQQGHKEFTQEEKFSHTYPERFWPKYANFQKDTETQDEAKSRIVNSGFEPKRFGIRFPYGDLDDLINLLRNQTHTRQAYLPIWFPEDTGAVDGQRVPCTLGYLFRVIDGYMHITYKIRSCDYLRHFRDDVYMAIRLLNYVNNSVGLGTKMGLFKFQADSLHVFAHERNII